MIIGIDPDIDKNGIAVCIGGKITELHNLNFVNTVQFISDRKSFIKKVVVESGWLINKSNFNLNGRVMSVVARERIAKNVGENHATGKHLVAYIESLEIKVQLLNPQGKIKAKEFNRMTGWNGRTNQEIRDAGMLIVGMT